MTVVDPFADLRGPMEPRPFDLASLLEVAGEPSPHRFAIRLGISGSTITRARDHELTWQQADTWACRAGFHPAEVWPHWYAEVDPEDDE